MGNDEKTRVLVIDDEESIRTLLRISLIHKGFEVTTAENGEKGLKAFERQRHPIVITDIKMPGMDGLQVLTKIRRIDPDTRVIVITGHGDMKSAIESLKLEASDFINKPIKDEALTVALKRAEEILWMKHKLRDYTGSLEAMVKEATEDLKKAHEFEKNLIQSSIDAIIASDRNGTIIVFNRGSENLLGYRAQEVLGRMQMDRIYPEGILQKTMETFRSPACGGENRLINYETALLSTTGAVIPVRTSGTALFEEGREVGVVCFFQDLREIKRLERELLQNERLSAVGQTIAGMAHYHKEHSQRS